MDQREPPTAPPGSGFDARRGQPPCGPDWEGESILVRLEECLDRLDRLKWTLPAAHLSQAVESVRERVLWLRIEQDSGAEGVSS
ncbi:MAG: hypothetical protein ABW194_03035 [Novosphingobium sp.]